MVPRLRHRIGIETLRRELDAVHASSAAQAANHKRCHSHTTSTTSTSSTSSTAPSISPDDAWLPNAYLSTPCESVAKAYSHKHHHNGAVGDKIPGFRTSAGKLVRLAELVFLSFSRPRRTPLASASPFRLWSFGKNLPSPLTCSRTNACFTHHVDSSTAS